MVVVSNVSIMRVAMLSFNVFLNLYQTRRNFVEMFS